MEFLLVTVYEVRRKELNMGAAELLAFYKTDGAHIVEQTSISRCEEFCTYGHVRIGYLNGCKFFLPHDSNGDGVTDVCILVPPTTKTIEDMDYPYSIIFVKMELNINSSTVSQVMEAHSPYIQFSKYQFKNLENHFFLYKNCIIFSFTKRNCLD